MKNPLAEAIVKQFLESMTKEEAVENLTGMPPEVRKNYYVWHSPSQGYSFGPGHGFMMVGSAEAFLKRNARMNAR